MLLRTNKWRDDMLLRTKQSGDAIHLGENKPGMLCFSEQTNEGCYASQNIQTGDAILLRTKQTGMLFF
jgi:hypothetical protein